MNVLFIGGDQRQIEIIRIFKAKGFNIHILGFENLMQSFVEVRKMKKKEVDFNIYDFIILPVNGIKDDGTVFSSFSNHEIILTIDDFYRMKEECIIFTGIRTKKLNEFIEQSNRRLVSLMDRDDVAIFNSIPTAEGSIMMIIENTDFTIHNSNIIVFGFGRTGITLARTMKALGANVSVAVRKDKDFARVFEMNFKPIYIKDVKSVMKDQDIIINTIPIVVLDSELLEHVKHDVFILDLASKPGGVDYEFTQNYGIKAILAPGLPGLVAPKTAGKILADAIFTVIGDLHE